MRSPSSVSVLRTSPPSPRKSGEKERRSVCTALIVDDGRGELDRRRGRAKAHPVPLAGGTTWRTTLATRDR